MLTAAAAILYFAIHIAGLHKQVAKDSEGIGALLQIIGTLYSVVYAFAISPFEGTWNVGSRPFEDLATKYR